MTFLMATAFSFLRATSIMATKTAHVFPDCRPASAIRLTFASVRNLKAGSLQLPVRGGASLAKEGGTCVLGRKRCFCTIECGGGL